MGKENFALWESAKYISWPFSLANPIVRVPRASGTPESKTIARLPGETEESLFLRCLQYRDERGIAIWGARRWAELLQVQARSVARHRKRPAGPQTGVYHYARSNSAPSWIASWYELQTDGTRRVRRKVYSYGTPRAAFRTSEQAEAAALKRRNLEEARWYCVGGIGKQRQVNPL